MSDTPEKADDAKPQSLPKLRRRDFLKVGALGLFGYAALKAGFSLAGENDTGESLKCLTPTQAETIRQASARLNGPASEASLEKGLWDPVATFDELLTNMPSDQRAMLSAGLTLFEFGRLGLQPFSQLSEQAQILHLEGFRRSSLALKRSIWGVLRAGSSLAYFGTTAGWEFMNYPGPCLPSGGHPGRAPGQSAAFDWDEKVP